jgi:hypothetical protein
VLVEICARMMRAAVPMASMITLVSMLMAAPARAGLGDEAASLFVGAVNDRIRGRIEAQSIEVDAADALILRNASLYDPAGERVVKVSRARVEVSLSSLIVGEVSITGIDIDDPDVALELQDEELNLVRALTPRERKKPSDPSDMLVEIGRISVQRGKFRFRNQAVTVEASGISATAKVDIDLGRKTTVVSVQDPSINSGIVKLNNFDIPMRNLKGTAIRFVNQRLVLEGVRGVVLNADLRVDGNMQLGKPGAYDLSGTIEGDGGHWPERMTRPAFNIPRIRNARVRMTGPLADPVIDIRGGLGPTVIAGYALHGADVDVRIDKDQILFNDGSVVRISRGGTDNTVEGTASVQGKLTFRDLALDVRAQVKGLTLRAAVQTSSLKDGDGGAPKGVFDGTVRVDGSVQKDYRVNINAWLQARQQVVVSGVSLREPVLRGDVVVTSTTASLRSVDISDDDVSAKVSGDVRLEERSVDLRLAVRAKRLGQHVAAIPARVVIDEASFDGTVRGPYDDVDVQGAVQVPQGQAYGAPVSGLTAQLAATTTRVEMRDLNARVMGGALRAKMVRMGLGGRGRLEGLLTLSRGDLALLKNAQGESLDLQGIVDIEANLGGTTDQPRVGLRMAGGGVHAGGEHLGEVTVLATASKKQLLFDRVSVHRTGLHATASALVMDNDTLVMGGVVQVKSLDLGTIEALRAQQVTGSVQGQIILEGDVRVPAMRVAATLKDIAVRRYELGNGSADVTIGPDVPCADKRCSGTPRLLQVRADVAGLSGSVQARASWRLGRDVGAVDVALSDVDIARLMGAAGLDEAAADLHVDGLITGKVMLSGPLEQLDGDVRLVSREVRLTRSGKTRVLGKTRMMAHVERGLLGASLCSLSSTTALTNQQRLQLVSSAPGCDTTDQLHARIVGTMDLRGGNHQLRVQAALADAHVEDFVPSLRAQEVMLGATAFVDGEFSKVAGQDAVFGHVRAWLDGLSLQLPQSPKAFLQAPVQLVQEAGVVRLLGTVVGGAARLRTPAGDVDLALAAGSSVSSTEVEARLTGTADLAALKLVTNAIANAQGRARIDVTAAGRFEDGVALQGFVEPIPGASMVLRSVGEVLQFDGGRISFGPQPSSKYLRVSIDGGCDGSERTRNRSCPMNARLRDAPLTLEGSFDLLAAKATDNEVMMRKFDVRFTANGATIRTADGSVTSNVDVRLVESSEGQPVATGRIEITDGSLRREFQLRNFLLSEAPAAPTDPLWQRMQAYGLADLAFAVDVSVRNLRGRATINGFAVDMAMRGELRVGRSLRLPSVEGTIEAEDGTVVFPKVRFQVAELQAQFPTSVDGRIRPTLHLTANGEVEPGIASAAELPITFSMDGPLNAIQLDVRAVDDDHPWTRAELFALMFFNVVPPDVIARLSDGAGNSGVNTVTNLFVQELAAPVTGEVENWAYNRFGLDVQLGVGDVQLQLGKRLSVEGTLNLSSTNTTTATGTAVNNDNVRVRLLLLDHLPWGRSIAGDGRFGASTDLRLTFRIFEGT